MNEETTLGGVKWRFSEGEHDDADVRWLLAEVDRLRAQVAAVEALLPRWEDEMDEQTRAREFGLAEGFRVAREDVLEALNRD